MGHLARNLGWVGGKEEGEKEKESNDGMRGEEW
jgi:hypothetical protein